MRSHVFTDVLHYSRALGTSTAYLIGPGGESTTIEALAPKNGVVRSVSIYCNSVNYFTPTGLGHQFKVGDRLAIRCEYQTTDFNVYLYVNGVKSTVFEILAVPASLLVLGALIVDFDRS